MHCLQKRLLRNKPTYHQRIYVRTNQLILSLLSSRRVNVASERDATNDSVDARGFENSDRGDCSSLQNHQTTWPSASNEFGKQFGSTANLPGRRQSEDADSHRGQGKGESTCFQFFASSFPIESFAPITRQRHLNRIYRKRNRKFVYFIRQIYVQTFYIQMFYIQIIFEALSKSCNKKKKYT